LILFSNKNKKNKKELENVPNTTTSYRAVGKLFIQSPLPDITTTIKETISKLQEEITKAEVKKKLNYSLLIFLIFIIIVD